MKASLKETTKKYPPRPPIPKEFREYLALIAGLADSIALTVTKPLDHESIEYKAYRQSYQYEDLKNISRAYAIEMVFPNCIKYEGEPLSYCMKRFWTEMKAIGMRRATIKIIDEATDTFWLEVAEYKDKKRDLRQMLRNMYK